MPISSSAIRPVVGLDIATRSSSSLKRLSGACAVVLAHWTRRGGGPFGRVVERGPAERGSISSLIGVSADRRDGRSLLGCPSEKEGLWWGRGGGVFSSSPLSLSALSSDMSGVWVIVSVDTLMTG